MTKTQTKHEPSIPVVKQAMLIRYLEAKALIDKLKADLSATIKALNYEILENSIRGGLMMGGTVEEGKFTAYLKDGRRCPSWKEAYISLVGETAAERLIAATEPSKILVVAASKLLKEE